MFRETLLQATRTIVPVETRLGGTYVRSITAGEKDDIETQHSKDGKLRARILLVCCCTEDGRPEFTNRDLPALDELPLDAVEPIIQAAIDLNRMSPEALEGMRKNSASPADDSSIV